MQLGTNGMQRLRQRYFCAKEIDLRKHGLAVVNQVGIRTKHIRHGLQNTDAFTPLCAFQFTDMIIGVHHLLRLYIDGLAGSRLVMHDAAYFAFERRRDGNDQTPFT